ncbi:hypothetical protein [Actinoplanes sp. NPDC051851]|uniref:hypothetical protein n=1 Tax=Actinoplanes sp. NPDC051851 TaxID=3154753 RepID=UPI00342174AF
MTGETPAACAMAALLRPGGPVRVPFRECCVAALIGAPPGDAWCSALGPAPEVTEPVEAEVRP